MDVSSRTIDSTLSETADFAEVSLCGTGCEANRKCFICTLVDLEIDLCKPP